MLFTAAALSRVRIRTAGRVRAAAYQTAEWFNSTWSFHVAMEYFVPAVFQSVSRESVSYEEAGREFRVTHRFVYRTLSN